VTVSGIPSTPALAAPPTLGQVGFTNQQFSFSLIGSVGSNYVIQAATNLNTSNWIALRTNASPFTYTESNSFPARFYRAIALP